MADTSYQESAKVKALRYFVVGFGVFLVIASAILMIYALSQGTKSSRNAADIAVDVQDGEVAPYDMKLILPERARVRETFVDNGRLILQLRLPDNKDAFIVIDLSSGKQVGQLQVGN